MKRITQRSAALAVTLVLAFATVAMSAPKSERSKKSFTIEGTILQINQKARTLLVADRWSDKLYLATVPKGVDVKVTFGLYMNQGHAEFWQLTRNTRVQMQCIRTEEHLARLDDGREVIVLTATN
ncbi:MAG TPA: hypothetical protein VKF81_04420 [Blastocatellia bacterium]|nr:hypothetical protein [Blastocatellia bacterium]